MHEVGGARAPVRRLLPHPTRPPMAVSREQAGLPSLTCCSYLPTLPLSWSMSVTPDCAMCGEAARRM